MKTLANIYNKIAFRLFWMRLAFTLKPTTAILMLFTAMFLVGMLVDGVIALKTGGSLDDTLVILTWVNLVGSFIAGKLEEERAKAVLAAALERMDEDPCDCPTCTEARRVFKRTTNRNS